MKDSSSDAHKRQDPPSKKEKSIKKQYFDSSDSEAESRVSRRKLREEIPSYFEYLYKDVIRPETISSVDHLYMRLGLALHNYADRVFDSPYVKSKYRKMKEAMLPELREEEARVIIGQMEHFLENEGQSIFAGTEGIKSTQDIFQKCRAYTKVFCYIFNDNVELPEGISLRETYRVDPSRERIIEGFRRSLESYSGEKGIERVLEKRRRDFLIFNRFVGHAEQAEGAESILAYSQLIRRRDRDVSKLAITHEERITKVRTELNTNIGGSEGHVTINHILHPSGNDQTKLNQLPTYERIQQKYFSKGDEDKELATQIKKFVSTGHAESKEALHVGCLMFIVEVHRNRAAAFTSAMFIDKVIKEGKANFTQSFPMAMKGTVDAVRDIHLSYKEELPNPGWVDEGIPRREGGNKLLFAEGEAFVNWLELNHRSKLKDLSKVLESTVLINKMRILPEGIPLEELELVQENVSKLGLGIPPQDRTRFIQWANDKEVLKVLEASKLAAFDTLYDDIVGGFNILDKKVLQEWYNIPSQDVWRDKEASRLPAQDSPPIEGHAAKYSKAESSATEAPVTTNEGIQQALQSIDAFVSTTPTTSMGSSQASLVPSITGRNKSRDSSPTNSRS